MRTRRNFCIFHRDRTYEVLPGACLYSLTGNPHTVNGIRSLKKEPEKEDRRPGEGFFVPKINLGRTFLT